MTAALETHAPRVNLRKAAELITRARALTAARTLFEAGSYADATMRSIAQGIGMTTGALYANFESKAALWTAVFGGPPPSTEIADEIARVLGELPQAIWTLTHHGRRFQVVITCPSAPTNHAEGPFVAEADRPASAFRKARKAALDARRAKAARELRAA